MKIKRHVTKPFATDTIHIPRNRSDNQGTTTMLAIAPFPEEETDTIRAKTNRQPSAIEEVLVPDDDKKGRTKWIR